MTTTRLAELRRLYVPHCKEFGRAALAKKFCCSVGTVGYWLSSEEQRERRRKWRRRKREAGA